MKLRMTLEIIIRKSWSCWQLLVHIWICLHPSTACVLKSNQHQGLSITSVTNTLSSLADLVKPWCFWFPSSNFSNYFDALLPLEILSSGSQPLLLFCTRRWHGPQRTQAILIPFLLKVRSILPTISLLLSAVCCGCPAQGQLLPALSFILSGSFLFHTIPYFLGWVHMHNKCGST